MQTTAHLCCCMPPRDHGELRCRAQLMEGEVLKAQKAEIKESALGEDEAGKGSRACQFHAPVRPLYYTDVPPLSTPRRPRCLRARRCVARWAALLGAVRRARDQAASQSPATGAVLRGRHHHFDSGRQDRLEGEYPTNEP